MAVTDLGDDHGASANVYAVKDYQEFDFSVGNGKLRANRIPFSFRSTTGGPTDKRNDLFIGGVSHELTAAPQNWFACLDTVNGEANYVLRWGVLATDGSAPTGCTATSVIQNFNVPGGATSSS